MPRVTVDRRRRQTLARRPPVDGPFCVPVHQRPSGPSTTWPYNSSRYNDWLGLQTRRTLRLDIGEQLDDSRVQSNITGRVEARPRVVSRRWRTGRCRQQLIRANDLTMTRKRLCLLPDPPALSDTLCSGEVRRSKTTRGESRRTHCRAATVADDYSTAMLVFAPCVAHQRRRAVDIQIHAVARWPLMHQWST